MRGFTVRGTSCPSDRQRVRRRARQEAIEMAQGDALGQAIVDEVRSALDGYVQEGAWRMLQRALEYEVENFLAEHALRADNKGRKQVVHNGYLPARTIMTGELIPWLYLKGISTGDYTEALEALLGRDTKGFSPNVIVRLKEKWGPEYEAWSRRDLTGEEYVYVWADGIHVNVRLEDEGNQKQCLLVLMGATAEGRKELIAVIDGVRESKQSWQELLLDLKQRGLSTPPKLAVGDGALGFWAALREVYPTTREQRCWVHKTANVLNKMPKALQSKAKSDLRPIWLAETRGAATKAFDHFLEKYGTKYEAACNCLSKDREALLAFYDFPAEHWSHLRTTNPIESTFATIRLTSSRTKGSGSRKASLTMMFKLAQSASRRWRRLNAHHQIVLVLEGRIFTDGVLQNAA